MQNIQCTAFSLKDGGEDTLSDAWSVLDQTERERAKRLHFDRDRNRFVNGRAMLRHLLAKSTDQRRAQDVRIETGSHGKPFLPDADHLHFNLSHSEDLAVFALSEDGPVGVDVEYLGREIDPLALGKAVFQEHELAILRNLRKHEQPGRFFAYWTAKEAVMKLTGEGMSLRPTKIALQLDANGLPTSASISARTEHIHLMPIDLGVPDFGCTLATHSAAQCSLSPLSSSGGHPCVDNL